MTVYAITDTKKGEQGLRLLIFKLPVNVKLWVSYDEKYLIFMVLKVRKWTVISPAKNYQNSLKRALLRRKKLHWPRLIWPTRYKRRGRVWHETKKARWHLAGIQIYKQRI